MLEHVVFGLAKMPGKFILVLHIRNALCSKLELQNSVHEGTLVVDLNVGYVLDLITVI